MADHTPANQLDSANPATGESLGRVRLCTQADYESVMSDATSAFESWRMYPARKRARSCARSVRSSVGTRRTWQLIALEMGKIYPEALGECRR
jgi:aldehyde dehydrogenase (NAD+)